MKWFSNSNARNVIIAASVAAITALVMTTAPALAGNSAPNATPSPVIISGHRSLAVINGPTTIARLALPAGSWTIFAKADVSTVSGPVELHCKLKAGNSSDHTDTELENGGTAATTENFVLNVVHKFARASAALLSCDSAGVVVNVSSIRMTAIKAGKLTIETLMLV